MIEGATTGGDEYNPPVQLNSKLQPSLAAKMKSITSLQIHLG